MQIDRARVADLLLWVIGVVGIVPLVFMAPATLTSGASPVLSNFALLGQVGVIVFALIFLLGAGLCLYLGNARKLVLVLPALLVALLPVLLNLSPVSVSRDLTERLARIENPWTPVEMNLRTLMETINRQSGDRLPPEQWENARWQFAIFRNGGLRELTFSTWNGGIRALTSAYLRGDYVGREERYTMGWSVWVLGTREPQDSCVEADQVRHYYLRGDRQGIVPASGNGCVVEGTVYRRRRHITLPSP